MNSVMTVGTVVYIVVGVLVKCPILVFLVDLHRQPKLKRCGNVQLSVGDVG